MARAAAGRRGAFLASPAEMAADNATVGEGPCRTRSGCRRSASPRFQHALPASNNHRPSLHGPHYEADVEPCEPGVARVSPNVLQSTSLAVLESVGPRCAWARRCSLAARFWRIPLVRRPLPFRGAFRPLPHGTHGLPEACAGAIIEAILEVVRCAIGSKPGFAKALDESSSWRWR
jgi:hypothetical protein